MGARVRTLLLDCNFTLGDADSLGFSSVISVFDYDVVIWDPRGTFESYIGQRHATFRGRPSLSETDSVALVDSLERRGREFRDFLELGRAVVVIASPPCVVWVDTGAKETSGTGRNQKVTRLVKDVDLLQALPFAFEGVEGSGIELELASEAASDLWQETKAGWMYRCILERYPGEPLFRVEGVDKTVGSFQITEKGGFIAVVPEPWIPEDEDFKGDRNANAKALFRWVQRMCEADAEALPSWCAEVLFPSALEREANIVKAEASLDRILVRIEKLKTAQAEDDQWKRLIASQGTQLERQVQAGFEILGFDVLEVRPGRSDLRLSRDGQIVVVEVKGVGKSAAEKNAAQLEKWVAEELADGVRAKGILLVNGWYRQPPAKRRSVFPQQMLKYSTTRDHCLVTGIQLLAMARGVLDGNVKADDAARQLLNCVGVLEGFDDPSEFLVVRPDMNVVE